MSNCLLFALALLIRRWRRGRSCRIVIRKSLLGWFPHFIFVEQRRGAARLVHYVPVRDGEWHPLFEGWVKWGERAIVLDPYLTPVLTRLRGWAADDDGRGMTLVRTRFGQLAFFKDQIDKCRTDYHLECYLLERVSEAKADSQARL